MSKSNIISINKNFKQQEQTDVSLSFAASKIRKIIDEQGIVDQIIEITEVIKNLNVGEQPYTEIVNAYKSSVIFKHQVNLMIRKLPTVVIIELMDILGAVWPKDTAILKRLQMLLIKSLETGMNFRQIQQVFFQNMDVCDYLLQGSKDLEESIHGSNVTSFPPR